MNYLSDITLLVYLKMRDPEGQDGKIWVNGLTNHLSWSDSFYSITKQFFGFQGVKFYLHSNYFYNRVRETRVIDITNLGYVKEYIDSKNYFGLTQEIFQKTIEELPLSIDDIKDIFRLPHELRKFAFPQTYFTFDLTSKKEAENIITEYINQFEQNNLLQSNAFPPELRYYNAQTSLEDLLTYLRSYTKWYTSNNIDITSYSVGKVCYPKLSDEKLKMYSQKFRILETILLAERKGYIDITKLDVSGTAYVNFLTTNSKREISQKPTLFDNNSCKLLIRGHEIQFPMHKNQSIMLDLILNKHKGERVSKTTIMDTNGWSDPDNERGPYDACRSINKKVKEITGDQVPCLISHQGFDHFYIN